MSRKGLLFVKVIIVGGGQVGGYIAELLIENGNEVVVIENKERAFLALEKNGLKKEIFLPATEQMHCCLRRQESAGAMHWYALQATTKQILR